MTALVLWGIGIVAVVYGLHLAALAAERRGWIYYRERRRSPVGLGLVAEVFSPEMTHVIEERTRQAVRRDAEEDGAPPDDEFWLPTVT